MTRYIFCINPGRAGSNYLQHIFNNAEGVASYHEPSPIMNAEPMIDFLNGNPSKLEALMPAKIKFIENSLKGKEKVYAETNHTFIKGFGWLIPKFLPEEEMGIIILKRDNESIAKSLYRIKCNAFNNDGRGWLIHINAKSKITSLPARVKLPYLKYYYYRLLHRSYYFVKSRPYLNTISLGLLKSDREPETPYNLNMEFLKWYVDETYALGEKYKRVFPKAKYYEINLHELNDTNHILSMFKYFGLRPKDSLKEVVGKPTNLKKGFI